MPEKGVTMELANKAPKEKGISILLNYRFDDKFLQTNRLMHPFRVSTDNPISCLVYRFLS